MKPGFVPLEFEGYPDEEMVRRSVEFRRAMGRRRTVRHFSSRAVPRSVVENAVMTAGSAPSGAHRQPWHFVLVGEPGLKADVRRAAEKEEKESYERRMPDTWLADLEPMGVDWHKPYLEVCPWLIAIFAEAYGIDDDGRKHKNYYVQESVGIATGLLIAALHHAGVATVTHTPSPMGFLRDLLGRPGNERAYMLLALGHPVEGCTVPDLERKSQEAILSVVPRLGPR